MIRAGWVTVIWVGVVFAQPSGMIRSALGVRADGTPMECWITKEDLDYHTRTTRVLVVGGSAGEAVRWFYGAPEARGLRERFAVSAALVEPGTGYPPPGEAYRNEAMYLWRWIGMHAPDLVVARGGGEELVKALGGVATIPAIVAEDLQGALKELGPSPARREMQRRLGRAAGEVARQLSAVYGHEMKEMSYIPAVALIGRIRLGEVADVEKIIEPWLKAPAGQGGGLPYLAGYLVFGELGRVTGKERYTELVRAAADRVSRTDHNEMSDAVFMGCALLAWAKDFDGCVRYLKSMQKLDLRPDGLYRHSPLDEAAWGRGNGFPALGLALSLSELPADHPGRGEMLRAFRSHMEALARHQDPTGAWHQVIDHPESYRELTATSMIAFAMIRGVRSGWLERAAYAPLIERAWYAIRTRVAANGDLVDVCASTGKQKSLRAYLERPAILGPDARGGAMALLVATEMMQWENERL
ncbi:MAG: glycoside hydrolase family 88 protein [Acidobacteria bacterium]|nr:glycoside hydrolase family 88 protein [Acidobacteriota bacterium]